MSYQAPLGNNRFNQPNGKSTSLGSSRGVVHNVADVVSDVTELAELQAKLFAADLRAVLRGAVVPLIALVAGACLLLGSTPIALHALADVLETRWELSSAAALGTAAICGVAIAGLFALIGWTRLRSGLQPLERSKAEFQKNVHWVRTVLKRR